MTDERDTEFADVHAKIMDFLGDNFEGKDAGLIFCVLADVQEHIIRNMMFDDDHMIKATGQFLAKQEVLRMSHYAEGLTPPKGMEPEGKPQDFIKQ